MKEFLGYTLLIVVLGAIILVAAEQGGVVGTDLSGRMVRFIKLDF